MPRNSTTNSRFGNSDQELIDFFATESLTIDLLIRAGARRTVMGLALDDEIIERALRSRDDNLRHIEQALRLRDDSLRQLQQTDQLQQAEGFQSILTSGGPIREMMSRVSTEDNGLTHDFELESSSPDEDMEGVGDDDDDDGYNRIVAKDFRAFEIPRFQGTQRDLESLVNDYSKQVEYRLRWIFYREEREGFRRRHSLVQPFAPHDFYARIDKASKPHDMNNEISMFYDWNLGSTDFILRLEGFRIKGIECLRCHFVHKPTGATVGYQDRAWDLEHYREVNMRWAEVE